MKKMNKKGFTIVELVIVIAVIAILAAVMIPTFSGIVGKAQQSAVLQKATAEYKEAYALAISDGVITSPSESVTVAGGSYTFVFSGTIDNISCAVTDSVDDNYTVTWDAGQIKVN